MKNLKRLKKYGIGKYKINAYIAVVFLLIDIVAGFYIPYVTQDIINEYIPNKDLDQIIIFAILMIFLAFTGLIAVIMNSFFCQKAAQAGAADLRQVLFNKIQKLSFRNVDNISKGRLITSVTNDITQVRMFYSMLYSMILRAPIMLIGGVIFAYNSSPELSRIYIVIIPALIISVATIITMAYPYFTKVQKKVDAINSVAIDNVNSPRVFKSFVTEEKENKRFQKVNKDYSVNKVKAGMRINLFMPVSTFILNAGTAGLIILTASLIDSGVIDANQKGTLIAFNSYSMRVMVGVMIMTMSMMVITRAIVSAKRINEILDIDIDLLDSDNCIDNVKIKGQIEFKNVSFRYVSGSNYVFENMSFNIEAGERIGIIGSTGSGKSSLVKMIPRLYDTSEGEVLIDGIDVKEYKVKSLREQISMATQEAILFSGDIKKNILQGNKKATKNEIDEASEMACAKEFIDSKEMKYDEIVFQKGANLSGGQKQRLSLTRALVRKPSILILDDITSALDAKSEELVRNNLKNSKDNPTTIIISQKIASIKDLDKIMVIDNYGNIDGFAPHEELLQKSIVYKEIYESQFGGVINE